ncbi:MAG: phage baseplate assembly protein V [Rhizobiales bacterium]|nr:phage baseplate assembly protein V [Hyphomicrobiales bacterium]
MPDTGNIAEITRLLENVLVMTSITEVDTAKAKVKVAVGDGSSGWLPFSTPAGKVSIWSPPSVGQSVMLLSPSGNIDQAIVLSGGFNDANPPKSSEADCLHISIGSSSLFIKDGEVIIKADKITVEANEITHKAPKVVIDSDKVLLGGTDANVPVHGSSKVLVKM